LAAGVQYQQRPREGSAKKPFKEELMKSLSELADVYKEWATGNEAHADEILAAQDFYAYEVRPSALACGTLESGSCRTEEESGRTTEVRRWHRRNRTGRLPGSAGCESGLRWPAGNLAL
jgi:hypothetical protein